jgi:DNA invertase Pin-like site-specific DNA recombinase
MTKRAAIYARVSTDDQRSNYSVPTQLAACLQSVRTKGYALVGNLHVNLETGADSRPGDGTIPAFVDDYTSRELSRPGLDAAVAYLETVGFDVLVVHALDRLARDPYIRQTLELEFGKRSCKVEFVLGNYEESAEGERNVSSTLRQLRPGN